MLKCSTFLLKVSRRVLGQFALVTHLIIWKMAPKSKLLLSNLEDGHSFDQASLQWKMDPLNSEFISSSNSCCNSCLITFKYVLKNWRNINWPNEVLGNWCLIFFLLLKNFKWNCPLNWIEEWLHFLPYQSSCCNNSTLWMLHAPHFRTRGERGRILKGMILKDI